MLNIWEFYKIKKLNKLSCTSFISLISSIGQNLRSFGSFFGKLWPISWFLLFVLKVMENYGFFEKNGFLAITWWKNFQFSSKFHNNEIIRSRFKLMTSREEKREKSKNLTQNDDVIKIVTSSWPKNIFSSKVFTRAFQRGVICLHLKIG